jgi:hypothetical protein
MTTVRAGRDIVTVHLYREIYDRIKDRAESERYPTKEYLNELLQSWLEKEKFMNEIAGHLSIDDPQDFGDNRITIRDTKEKKLIDVYLKDCDLHCDFHQSNCCIHTRYLWSRPEMGRITRKNSSNVNGGYSGNSGEDKNQTDLSGSTRNPFSATIPVVIAGITGSSLALLQS